MKPPKTHRRTLLVLSALALGVALTAWWAGAGELAAKATREWHQWLGPDRNNISAETTWSADWGQDGPKVLWKINVGTGWSGVAVSQGRAFTMGNKDKTDTVFCLDAETGEVKWKKSYPCPAGSHPGPRCTPTVDGDRVYTVSNQGNIICFRVADGKPVWDVDARKAFGSRPPSWGFACSPLVMGKQLIVDVGTVAALDKATGRVAWKSRKYMAGYSSPVLFQMGGKPCLAIFNAAGLTILDAANGKQLAQLAWKTSYNVNAATPLIVGEDLFISSGYGTGCALVKPTAGEIKVLWRNKAMRNHFSTCVLHEGNIYGVDGNVGRAGLACLSAKTGEVKWSHGRWGMGSLLLAGGKLIALTDKGRLFTCKASPEGFQELSGATVISGKCWTAPVLSGGRIYCRSHQGQLVCVDVRKK